MSRKFIRRPHSVGIVLLLTMSVALLSCATPTPYQAASGNYGYQEREIEPGRFEISFSGNSMTDEETVENYLLYRSAQKTLETGNEHFVVVEHDGDFTFSATPNYFPHHYFHFSIFYHQYPRFTRYGRFARSGGYGPYGGFGSGLNYYSPREMGNYTAIAEITVHPGERPGDNPRAYDAQDVMDNLERLIVEPETAS